MARFDSLNRRKLVTAGMLALFVVGVALALRPKAEGPAERQGFGARQIPVEVAKVVRKPLVKDLRTIGTIEPWTETTLAAEVEGPVERVHVEEGERVEEGALLVSLGTREAQLAVDKARADLAGAKADRDTAAADAIRAKNLHKEGAISDSELARWELSVSRARASADSADAALALANRRLDKTSIRAPFAGAVTGLEVEIGEWVKRGGAVLTLTALDRLKVRTAIEERDLPFVSVGQTASVEADAVPGRHFAATVMQILPRAEDFTPTFPILFSVPNP